MNSFSRRKPENEVRLSVVIPTYNDGAFLLEALESAYRFAPPGSEVIVVDDGSDDPASLDALAAIDRSTARVFRQANLGVSAARNRAVAVSAGRFILPLDGDDRLTGYVVDDGLEFLESSDDYGVYYGGYQEFGTSSARMNLDDFDPDLMLFDHNLVPACALFRRTLWEGTGGYDESLPAAEDYDFWIRAYSLGWKFFHHPEPLFEYRRRPNSLSSRLDDPATSARILARILSRNARVYLDRLGWLKRQFSDDTAWAQSVTPLAYAEGLGRFVARVESIEPSTVRLREIVRCARQLESMLHDAPRQRS